MIFGHLATTAAITGIFFAASPWQMGFWLVVAGLGTSQISTNLFAVAQIFSGPRAAGGWVGMQNALGNISGIVGPIVTGILVEAYGGYGWAFALAAAMAGLGAVWWALLVPQIRQVVD
jgi:MFS family permease